MDRHTLLESTVRVQLRRLDAVLAPTKAPLTSGPGRGADLCAPQLLLGCATARRQLLDVAWSCDVDGRDVSDCAGALPGALIGKPDRAAGEQSAAQDPAEGCRADADVLQARSGDHKGDRRADVAVGRAR